MIGSMVEILAALGILGVIQVIAVSMAAIFLFRYFTDRG